MGRPANLTPRQKHDALKARAAGTATQADLARRLNVGQGTISRLAASTPATLPNRTNRVDLTIQSPGHLVNVARFRKRRTDDRRPRRNQASLIFKRYRRSGHPGQITNDDFEEREPETAAPAIRAICSTAGLFYHDNFTPRLVERYRLPPEIQRDVPRWVLFLDNDHPCVWPLRLFMATLTQLGEAIGRIKCMLGNKLI